MLQLSGLKTDPLKYVKRMGGLELFEEQQIQRPS